MDLLPFGPGMRPDKRLAAPQRPSFAEALRFWFKLGWISFGGTCASPKFCAHRKKHEFPGATAVPSRLPFTLERQESLPEERPRGVPVYIGWRYADVFATLGWFGLGSPIVP